jgi:hypothetical protein
MPTRSRHRPCELALLEGSARQAAWLNSATSGTTSLVAGQNSPLELLWLAS